VKDIKDRLMDYIDRIPDGVHTCSDACLKPSCLIVGAWNELVRLQDQNSSLLATNYDLRKERDCLTDLLDDALVMLQSRAAHDFDCPRGRDDYDCTCGLSDVKARIEGRLARPRIGTEGVE
jgi:hypothetical protein